MTYMAHLKHRCGWLVRARALQIIKLNKPWPWATTRDVFDCLTRRPNYIPLICARHEDWYTEHAMTWAEVSLHTTVAVIVEYALCRTRAPSQHAAVKHVFVLQQITLEQEKLFLTM
jgi:hypothetical protein